MSGVWNTKLAGDVTELRHHSCGVVTATISSSSYAGPRISVLSAADGTERRGLETDSDVSEVEYHDALGLLLVTTETDRVHAVDPATGQERWAADAVGVLTATADRVFLYAAARVWAYRATSGTVEWETTLPDEKYGNLSRNVADEKILVSVGESKDQGIVALDPDTGIERWYYRPGIAVYFLADDEIYVTFEDDDRDYDVARVDTTTGTEAWSYTGKESIRNLYSTTDLLYLLDHTNMGVAAVDPTTGTERWRSEVYGGADTLLIKNGRPYICWEIEEREYEFHALDPDTGRSAWHVEVNNNVNKAAFDASGDVYVGTREYDGDGGSAYKIDGTTGRVCWRFETGESVYGIDADATPTLVRNLNGGGWDEPSKSTLFAVDTDGNPLWTLSDENLTVMQATKQLVAVTNDDGKYYLLRRNDGTVEDHFDADAGTAAEDALFVADGSAVTAYALTSSPTAFEDVGTESSTVVYNGDDETSDTEVYDPDGNGSG